ncbi:MAG: TolC family protein [Oceanihabitans sp.]
MRTSITLILLLFTTIGFAQENPTNFSLQEAIDYALENNRTAKNAARDILVAEQQKKETTATGLPQLSAKVDYQNWLKQQVSLLPGELAGEAPGTFIAVPFGTKQSMNATATLNQLLFDGSYIIGLQSVKVYLEIAENAKEKTDLEVRKAVINAYGNVLIAKESIGILNRNITVLEKNLEEITKIYENGLEEEESVEQLQITLSSLKSQLKNTKRLQKLAYQMFNITIGIDVNNATVLTDSLELLTKQNMSLSLLSIDENIENTIDYKIANNDKTSKEILLKYEKSKALPSLSAFVNGGYIANSNTFSFVNKNQKWFSSSLLGVSLNIPIFSSGMRSAKTQRAKIDFEKSKDDLTEVEQQLKLKIAAAKSDYQFAIEEYQNKKDNLALAERIEQKNETKFFEGIASSFELRQAQTQLYASQQELLQAMLDVINNKAELETILNSTNN